MAESIRVVPTAANRIRAAAAANPDLSADELARHLGLRRIVVEMAMRKGDARRVKSVAP